jgi:hypothetical protein
VTIKTATGILKRPVTKICSLPHTDFNLWHQPLRGPVCWCVKQDFCICFSLLFAFLLTRQFWTLFWISFALQIYVCIFQGIFTLLFVHAMWFSGYCALFHMFACNCMWLRHVVYGVLLCSKHSSHDIGLASFSHKTKATLNPSRMFYMTSHFWEWGLAGQLCHELSWRALWHASSWSVSHNLNSTRNTRTRATVATSNNRRSQAVEGGGHIVWPLLQLQVTK